MIGSLGPHVATTLQTMSQWTNLAALLAGAVLGVLLSRVVRRIGGDTAALLSLLFAPAAIVDPVAALIGLGAAWAAALITLQDDGDSWWPLVAIILATVVTVLLIGPLIALVPRLEPLETTLLLIAAAALAVVISAGQTRAGWLSALVLVVLGVAADFTTWPLIESTKMSPRWMLCALLLVGPALVALLMPALAQRHVSGGPGLDVGATLLPVGIMALPITATGAILLLALSEHGLNGGQMLLMQRPRLALALVAAMLASGAAMALLLYMTQAFWAARLSQRFSAATLTRLSALLVLALVGALVVRLGLEPAEQMPAAIALVVGFSLAVFSVPPAPFLIGLVIGERLQAFGPSAMKSALAGPRPILCASLAVACVASALAWPLLSKRLARRQQF